MKDLANIIFVLVSLVIIYLPRFVLWQIENLTASELSEKFPADSWKGEAYPILMYLWCAALGIGLWVSGSYLSSIIGDKGFMALFSLFLAGFALFEGVFSFTTKVFPVSTRTSNLYYVTQKENLRGLSLLQIALSLIICFGVLLYYWY